MSPLKHALISLLTAEARLALWKHAPKIIAVTGSVGKTSAKDAIYAALSPHLYVRKSAKSFNSEIGVPLTILGLDNPWSDPLRWLAALARGLCIALFSSRYPEWLVVEVGADRPGDIRRTAQWLAPHIVVYTGVPEVPVHVEYFPSPEDVFKEKRSLAEHLRAGGTLIANADDPHARELRADAPGAFLSYGFAPNADLSASHLEIAMEGEQPTGMRLRVNAAGSSIPLALAGSLGKPRAYAALAALAAAKAAGIDLVSAARSLAALIPAPGRMRLVEGAAGAVIIDDTYNSSPAALHAALDTLAGIPAQGRKIAVLGDMLELGSFSAGEHRAAGERAAQAADMLVTIGFRARAMAEAARDAGMPEERVRAYEQGEASRAGAELRMELRSGDVVLVKGSQSMRMERTVEQLMAHPEQAQALLVRQDAQWKKR